jgi:hypothetical protein
MKMTGFDPPPYEALGWLAVFLALCALVTLAGCPMSGEKRLEHMSTGFSDQSANHTSVQRESSVSNNEATVDSNVRR